jgi:cation diffusion facilitator CzcD-associated flavoprotein CzcO
MHHPIIIIGAGPAGLAVAGRLRRLGIDFTILEKSDTIAASWQGHYDRLCLHTVKELSNLPHKAFPDTYPTYVPREDLVRYYEGYAEEFNIQPRFNNTVKKVEKADGHWKLSCEHGEVFTARHVVVASGVNHVPKRPVWKGEDHFQGKILHSKLYKNPAPFLGKKVLVIGMGNTGAEIALDLAEQGVETYISVRSPVNIVPRDLFGKPVQTSGKLLEKLPFGWGDWLGAQVRKVVFGDLSKYGVPLSKVPPAVEVRSTGKTPVIDLGTVRMIKEGKIQIVGDIMGFYEHGVVFNDSRRMEIDTAILATGYSPQLTNFIQGIEAELDKNGLPKKPISEQKGLYFVGYDNYSLGGLLGVIREESKDVVDAILRTVKTEAEAEF